MTTEEWWKSSTSKSRSAEQHNIYFLQFFDITDQRYEGHPAYKNMPLIPKYRLPE